MLSIQWVKDRWREGRRWEAVMKFLNHFPQITLEMLCPKKYPEEIQNDLICKNGWQFFGPNAVPTWWREFFHFLSGIGVTLPFFYWPKACFIVSFFISCWRAYAEFFQDAEGNPDLKNVIDWLFWVAGSVAVTIPSFLVFGTYPYK